MLGLGAYESSSEDEGETKTILPVPEVRILNNWDHVSLLNYIAARDQRPVC